MEISSRKHQIMITDSLITKRILFCVFWLISSIILLTLLWPGMDKALTWDEVDYVVAARQGYYANATDQTAFKSSEFLQFAWSKAKGKEVPEFIDYNEMNDVFNLRHSHPPLMQYLLALSGSSILNPNCETELRLVQFMGCSLLIATMLASYSILTDNVTLPSLFSISAVAITSGYLLGDKLNCHLWISISILPGCLAVGQFLAKPERGWGVLSGVLIGLNFLALQTGLFIGFFAISAVGMNIIFKNTESGDLVIKPFLIRIRFIQWISRSALIITGFICFVLMTYPGAFFRLSLIRIVAIYSLLILKSDEYSSVSNQYSSLLLITVPMIVSAVIALIALLLKNRNQIWYFTAAALIIGTGYGLILINFSVNKTYIMPSFVVLTTLGIASVSSMKIKKIELFMTIFMIFCMLGCIKKYRITDNISVDQIKQVAELIRGDKAFVEGGHIIEYYFPELNKNIVRITISGDKKSVTRRDLKRLQYIPVEQKELAGNLVIVRSFNNLTPYEWEYHLPDGVHKLKLDGFPGAIYKFPD